MSLGILVSGAPPAGMALAIPRYIWSSEPNRFYVTTPVGVGSVDIEYYSGGWSTLGAATQISSGLWEYLWYPPDTFVDSRRYRAKSGLIVSGERLVTIHNKQDLAAHLIVEDAYISVNPGGVHEWRTVRGPCPSYSQTNFAGKPDWISASGLVRFDGLGNFLSSDYDEAAARTTRIARMKVRGISTTGTIDRFFDSVQTSNRHAVYRTSSTPNKLHMFAQAVGNTGLDIVPDTVQFISTAFDGSSSFARIDGVQAAVNPGNDIQERDVIGSYRGGSPNYAPMDLYEYRYFLRQLTSAEVAAHEAEMGL